MTSSPGWDGSAPHSPGRRSRGPHSPGPHSPGPHSRGPHSPGPHSRAPDSPGPDSPRRDGPRRDIPVHGVPAGEQASPRLPQRYIDADPESVERGLVTLVLTLVEFLRQLMERQALRRVDDGDLSEDQVDDIGVTLMALEDRMAELREHFGLSEEDLNIDLGPLGSLLPRD